MVTIEIEPQGGDLVREVKRAIEILRQAGVAARRRSRSLEHKGLIQVADADAERALGLLSGSNFRAATRPS